MRRAKASRYSACTIIITRTLLATCDSANSRYRLISIRFFSEKPKIFMSSTSPAIPISINYASKMEQTKLLLRSYHKTFSLGLSGRARHLRFMLKHEMYYLWRVIICFQSNLTEILMNDLNTHWGRNYESNNY